MKHTFAALILLVLAATPAWAGECAIAPGGQCSLPMDPSPASVEIVNLDPDKGGSLLAYWLYSAQSEPRRVTAGLGPGEAAVIAPPKAKDGQGDIFVARTLVIFNTGGAPLSARTVR